MPTAASPRMGTLGDLFKPKKKVKTQKKQRYRRKDRSNLNRFASGTRVRCWWPGIQNRSLNGSIGIVCTERSPFGRKKHVVIPKAEEQTQIVEDEVAFSITEKVDKKINENSGVWFLTEEEYTLLLVMES
jgi:hypothetical protein